MLPFVIGILIFAFTITIHEYAHGFVANRCGDPTAKDLGRLSLNPIKHIDPFWTVMLPAFLLIIHSPFIFGMAKPVPVDFSRLHSPRRDMILVAAAGPLANIIFGILLLYVMKLTGLSFLMYMVFLNLLLGFFNLIPIPPLDGGRILTGLLPGEWAGRFARLEPYGFLVILVLMATGAVHWFLMICFRTFSRVFS